MQRSGAQSRNLFPALVLLSLAAVYQLDGAVARGATPDRSGRVQTGEASFYSQKEAGKLTASGAPLALNRMTAASPTLPLGSTAKVINVQTGQTVQVTINDRGPYAKGRVLDVTPKAAAQLGINKQAGVAPVKIVPVSEPVATR